MKHLTLKDKRLKNKKFKSFMIHFTYDDKSDVINKPKNNCKYNL